MLSLSLGSSKLHTWGLFFTKVYSHRHAVRVELFAEKCDKNPQHTCKEFVLLVVLRAVNYEDSLLCEDLPTWNQGVRQVISPCKIHPAHKPTGSEHHQNAHIMPPGWGLLSLWISPETPVMIGKLIWVHWNKAFIRCYKIFST